MTAQLWLSAVITSFGFAFGGGAAQAQAAEAACPDPAQWVVPHEAAQVAPQDLLAELASRDVVILGEYHGHAAIHRWQLHMLAALHARQRRMAIAFEAFPRSTQPALDRWVAGKMDVEQFFRDTRWGSVWGIGGEHYLPLFQFARMHRIPMVAMNVERGVVRNIGQVGLAGLAQDERAGVGDPAPPSAAYRQRLREVFLAKHREGTESEAPDEGRFERFVEAQSFWDRAFAESVAQSLHRRDVDLVVAIVGRGHAEYGDGMPAQLAGLGIEDTAVLLTHEAGRPCPVGTAPGPPIANALFGLDAEPEIRPVTADDRPRLGVLIEPATGAASGVRVTRVMDDSVAAAAGLRADDIILQAAGTAVADTSALVAIVRRQAPGTWLPITAQRGETMLDLVAKFPPQP